MPKIFAARFVTPEKRAESEGQTVQIVTDILNSGKPKALVPLRPQRQSAHITFPIEPQGHTSGKL